VHDTDALHRAELVTVDFHAHLARPEPNAPAFLRSLFDVDGYLERQAEAGIDLTVLSYGLSDGRGGDDLEEARAQHDFLAELVGRHPDRLAALAGIDPFGGKEWLAEAERALDAGFSGFCFPTSRRGRYLDSSDAREAFALANERRALVLVHPSDSPLDIDRAGDPFLMLWMGRPLDVGVCLSRMVIADTLADYPDVRVVAAQSGGMLPMLIGRLDRVLADFRQRPPEWGGPPGGRFPEGHPMAGGPSGGPPGGRLGMAVIRLALRFGLRPPGAPRGGDGPAMGRLPKEPLKAAFGADVEERVRRFYYDTASGHPAAIRAAIAAFGIERIVLGTDWPPVGEAPTETIDAIDAVGLTPDEREMILAGNARDLLGATPAAAT
jgi:predicted TIM-barrel fold metal-dependent hydrolase